MVPEPSWANENNLAPAQRSESLPTFVMDKLHSLLTKTKSAELSKLEEMFKPFERIVRDEHLAKPWNDASEQAAELLKVGEGRMQRELDAIKEHVEETYNMANEEMASRALKEQRSLKGKTSLNPKTFTDLPIEVRQDVLRKISCRFYSEPQGLQCLTPKLLAPKTVHRLKASYAYLYDHKPKADEGRKATRFPFNVAMRELCEIKAAALGCSKTVADEFYRCMTIGGGYLRKAEEEL